MAKRNNLAVKLPPVILAETVYRIYQQQQRVARLTRHLKAASADLKLLQDPVIELLETGAVLEEGAPPTSVKVSPSRRPKWKEEFVARLGAKLAQDIIEKTEPSYSKELVITVVGVL